MNERTEVPPKQNNVEQFPIIPRPIPKSSTGVLTPPLPKPPTREQEMPKFRQHFGLRRGSDQPGAPVDNTPKPIPLSERVARNAEIEEAGFVNASTFVPSQNNQKPTNPKDSFGVAKVSISRVSAVVISEVGLGMDEGGCKYGGFNYREAKIQASVYVDAVWRHLFLQWYDCGEDIDAPSGLSHVTKAISTLVVLRDSMIKGTWVDDRPPKHNAAIVDEFNKAKEALLKKFPNPKPNYTEKPL